MSICWDGPASMKLSRIPRPRSRMKASSSGTRIESLERFLRRSLSFKASLPPRFALGFVELAPEDHGSGQDRQGGHLERIDHDRLAERDDPLRGQRIRRDELARLPGPMPGVGRDLGGRERIGLDGGAFVRDPMAPEDPDQAKREGAGQAGVQNTRASSSDGLGGSPLHRRPGSCPPHRFVAGFSRTDPAAAFDGGGAFRSSAAKRSAVDGGDTPVGRAARPRVAGPVGSRSRSAGTADTPKGESATAVISALGGTSRSRSSRSPGPGRGHVRRRSSAANSTSGRRRRREFVEVRVGTDLAQRQDQLIGTRASGSPGCWPSGQHRQLGMGILRGARAAGEIGRRFIGTRQPVGWAR